MSNTFLSKEGFIYVASRVREYYEYALISCETLKEFHPESNVTLFTHEKFLDKRCKLFDNIVTGIPIHARAKMWCMARTPYEKTIYIDCDSIIRHKDVNKLHDFLENCDLFFGSQVLHTVTDLSWGFIDKSFSIEPKYHGSLCGYTNSKLNIDFMQTWFDEYVKQRSSPWKYEEYDIKWKQFDMFTLWRMTCGKFEEFKKFNELIIKILPRRYNNTMGDLEENYEGVPVITQIDGSFYQAMLDVWRKIENGNNNQLHKVKQRSLEDPFFELD